MKSCEKAGAMTCTYSYGMTPDSVVRQRAHAECPHGFRMRIRCAHEWAAIASAVNAGIDAHLEALTKRSDFDATTGACNVYPSELHVLCRRLLDGDESAWDLRSSILYSIGIEEI